MRLYYPQALVRVSALVQLSRTREQVQTATFIVRPRSLTIERNDYNTPDTISVELDAAKFPILPRLIRQVHLQVYAGDAKTIDPGEASILDDSYVRFCGYIDEPEMALSEEDGKITWKARDYTGLLLDFKRPPTRLVPSYQDRLDVALRRILDELPGGTNIKLRLDGLDEWPEISVGAPAGLKSAAIPCKPEDTAWHLIKRACDPVALIPRIELDTLVVATSRGLDNPTRRAQFLYGRNVAEITERRRLVLLREGIGLSGYSIADRKQITAVYPPAGDRLITKHLKPAVKKHGTPPAIPGTQDKRHWFPYGVVDNQEALDAAAERLFNERSRQEFDGTLRCTEMVVPDGVEVLNEDQEELFDYDVTGIANGDRVMIAIGAEHRALLGGVETTEARVQLLVDDGYEPDVASVLVAAWETGVDGPLEVYVRSATHKYDESGYELSIAYQNLLTVSA